MAFAATLSETSFEHSRVASAHRSTRFRARFSSLSSRRYPRSGTTSMSLSHSHSVLREDAAASSPSTVRIALPYRYRRSSLPHAPRPSIFRTRHSTTQRCRSCAHASRPSMRSRLCCMMLRLVRFVNRDKPLSSGKLNMNISTRRTCSAPRRSR